MTPVEWLYKQISYFEVGNDRIVLYSRDLAELVKQALEMEKISDEEIEKVALKWCKDIGEDGYVNSGDDYDIHELPAFIEGAKWYREQLRNKI